MVSFDKRMLAVAFVLFLLIGLAFALEIELPVEEKNGSPTPPPDDDDTPPDIGTAETILEPLARIDKKLVEGIFKGN